MMKKIFIMLLILNSGVCLANPFFAGVVLGHMLEPFIPDLRLEYSKQKENSSVVFSWPIHYWFNTNENSNFFISAFTEPQIAFKNDEQRIVGGSRALLQSGSEINYIAEAGGIVAQNGDKGFFAGIGFGWELDPNNNTAFILRTTKTRRDFRIDFSFDYWSLKYFKF